MCSCPARIRSSRPTSGSLRPWIARCSGRWSRWSRRPGSAGMAARRMSSIWFAGFRARSSPRRPNMPEPARRPFSYAILRVVLYCRQLGFLRVKVGLDERRLAALSPDTSAADVRAHLDALVRVAAGDPDGEAIAALPPSERFGWLVAPSSTIIQPSAVHTGLSDDPQATLDALFAE